MQGAQTQDLYMSDVLLYSLKVFSFTVDTATGLKEPEGYNSKN